MCQKQSFKPKAACHRHASALLLKAGWALLCTWSPAFHPDPLLCQKLPKKLFRVRHGSLLSINNVIHLNGRDHRFILYWFFYAAGLRCSVPTKGMQWLGKALSGCSSQHQAQVLEELETETPSKAGWSLDFEVNAKLSG